MWFMVVAGWSSLVAVWSARWAASGALARWWGLVETLRWRFVLGWRLGGCRRLAGWIVEGGGGRLGIGEAAGEVSCVERGPLWC